MPDQKELATLRRQALTDAKQVEEALTAAGAPIADFEVESLVRMLTPARLEATPRRTLSDIVATCAAVISVAARTLSRWTPEREG